MEFIRFISHQVLQCDFELSVSDGRIQVTIDSFHYSEPIFNSDVELNQNDIKLLQTLSRNVLNKKSIDSLEIPILKLWYIVTHEKYFISNIKYDKYDRVGIENLQSGFEQILKVPIADVLRRLLLKKLDRSVINKTTIYLTCDYDILNIWDHWNYKQFIKVPLKLITKGKFRFAYNVFISFFFSRISQKHNGYLNDTMFDYSGGFRNIAFFISETKNKQFDGNINYSNKPVTQFIDHLKAMEVEIDLHANYDTMDQLSNIDSQLDSFKKIFKLAPTQNRHHYLRCIFPSYLEGLDRARIKTDYSLYFPEGDIFRCGTSSQFMAWNAKLNKPFPTQLIPTTLMDGTFTDYLKFNEKEAERIAKNKLDLAMEYGDSIVLLWHNNSMYKYSNIQNNFHPSLHASLVRYIKEKKL